MSVREVELTEEHVATVPRHAAITLPDERLVMGLLVLVGLAASGLRFNDQLTGLTGDNATYILLARDLISGRPYENAGYPWGYPALLAPILAVVGADNIVAAIPWMKLLTLLLFAASLPVVYAFLRTRFGVLPSFGVTALVAINNVALAHANDIMSEVPYILASYGALLAWQRLVLPHVTGKKSQRLPWRSLLLVGLLVAAAYYIRTVGLALFGASVLALFRYRRWREGLALGALYALLALPWLVASRTSALNSYADQLLLRDPYNPVLGHISNVGEFLGRIASTAWLYITGVFPVMLLPSPTPALLQTMVAPLIAVLMVIGLAVALVRRCGLPELYTLLFLGVICAWPWTGDRFLLPLYPLLLAYTVEAALWIHGFLLSKRPITANAGTLARLGGAVFLVLALPNVWLGGVAAADNVRYISGQSLPSAYTPDWVSYFAACAWLKDHTPPDSVVMSRKTTLTTVYSSRPSVQIPLVSPARYPDYLKQYGVEYILEDAFDWSAHTINYLRPVLAADRGRYRLLYTTPAPHVRVWQVVK